MHKPPILLTLKTVAPTPVPGLRLGRQLLLLLILVLSAAVEGGSNLQRAQAQPQAQPLFAAAPATAPRSLKSTLAQIDAAANQRNLKAVMQFYSPNFTHSDGLTRQTLEKTLAGFWQRYRSLNYRTELKSWQPNGQGFIAETVTTITGTQQTGNQKLALNATLTARQHIVGQKILRQEILSEHSRVTSGAKPPTVEVNLPQQVKVGQTYNFDAIVKEPLGDGLLLGAALEEPVTPGNYLKNGPVKLEALPSGGIFKMGKAPSQAASRWLSAVLVREGGMTMVSQRLQVVSQSPAK